MSSTVDPVGTAARRAAQSVAAHARSAAAALVQRTELAVVRSASPLAAELVEGRLTLDESSLLLGAAARGFDADMGIRPGDNLVLTELATGDWLVVDVVTAREVRQGPGTVPEAGTGGLGGWLPSYDEGGDIVGYLPIYTTKDLIGGVSGPVGPQGDTGPQGPPGQGFNVPAGLVGGGADDSTPIQAEIDARAAAGGGKVDLPAGAWRGNVVLKDGVTLAGPLGGKPRYISGAAASLTAAHAGPAVDTPSGKTKSVGLYDLAIYGLGAGTPGEGVRFRDVDYGVVERVTVSDFADSGIRQDAGLACTYEDLVVIRCVLNRARTAVIGAVDIAGTDHWLARIESTISGSIEGVVQSANLYCVAIAIRQSNGWHDTLVGEISDVGIHVSGDGNRFVACRGDLNYGHGLYVTGSNNQFVICLALDNSQHATNTYDGFHFANASQMSQTDGCRASVSVAKAHRYGFYDDATTATQKNRHVNPFSQGAATGQYRNNTSSGSAFLFPVATAEALAANSSTPSVAGLCSFYAFNTVPTLITDFTGGVDGQVIHVYVLDDLTKVQHNGATIELGVGLGDRKLRQYATYTFVRHGGKWRLVEAPPVGATADAGNAAKLLTARIDGETQIWATPLTADRAVTLNTGGAFAGAAFRIVRAAAATGAFNLNVGAGPLKALAPGQWCDVTYQGAAWALTGFGSL